MRDRREQPQNRRLKLANAENWWTENCHNLRISNQQITPHRQLIESSVLTASYQLVLGSSQ